MAYISINPYTLEKTGIWPSDSDSQLNEKIEETFRAWTSWKTTPITLRIRLLENLSEVLTETKDYHASLIVTEMGKPVEQALAEVEKCALLSRYYAASLEEFLTPRERKSGAKRSYVRYDSQGIILGVMPWNYPYWQVFRFVLPAVAGGNAAVLKHASNVTACAFAIETAMKQAGFPESLFRVLLPEHKQIEKIIAMPGVRGVALTGSNEAGSRVASIAGRYIRKCILELGGSDPFIVFPDADIEKAAEGAVTGRFQNCGQSCIAAKRLIIHHDVYERFIERFIKLVGAMKAGDPSDPSVYIGPLVNVDAAKEIERQVEETIAMGATLLAGGRLGIAGPAFFEPTVLTDIPPQSPVAVEEVFGPVAPVFSFSTAEEAAGIANGSRFGLGASVWTSDEKLAEEMIRMVDTGSIAVNGFLRSDPALPFGGVKESGFGRELSYDGFYEFLNVKSVAYY
ncbi:MAG: NAD-dependent succinate-semialdehyde dehydrogenase [Bacteroidales bacterium]